MTAECSLLEYQVKRRADVMAPMRDGVRLTTDLYHPSTGGGRIPGGLPALMERTPYDKAR